MVKTDLGDHLQNWDDKKFQVSRSELRPTLNVVKFDKEKIELTLMGDTHIGSRFYNEKFHREILDWCLEEDAPIILMGDNIECATRDSVGAGLFEQDEIVGKQIEHFIELYKPLVEKGLILGLHTGNHEARIYKHSGVDIAKMMARELGVKYFGYGQLHQVRVGKENYMVYTTHGSSGARLPYTKIKACLDLANMVDAEIYGMGHLHQLSHHVRNFYSGNLQNKNVVMSQQHFLLTGHFLNHWGSYAHMTNMEPSTQGSPKIKLHGTTHRIRISL